MPGRSMLLLLSLMVFCVACSQGVAGWLSEGDDVTVPISRNQRSAINHYLRGRRGSAELARNSRNSVNHYLRGRRVTTTQQDDVASRAPEASLAVEDQTDHQDWLDLANEANMVKFPLSKKQRAAINSLSDHMLRGKKARHHALLPTSSAYGRYKGNPEYSGNPWPVNDKFMEAHMLVDGTDARDTAFGVAGDRQAF